MGKEKIYLHKINEESVVVELDGDEYEELIQNGYSQERKLDCGGTHDVAAKGEAGELEGIGLEAKIIELEKVVSGLVSQIAEALAFNAEIITTISELDDDIVALQNLEGAPGKLDKLEGEKTSKKGGIKLTPSKKS